MGPLWKGAVALAHASFISYDILAVVWGVSKALGAPSNNAPSFGVMVCSELL